MYYLLTAVVRTIYVITNDHKSPESWKLVLFSLQKRRIWGPEKISNLPKLIWSLSDRCGERGRAAGGMILVVFCVAWPQASWDQWFPFLQWERVNMMSTFQVVCWCDLLTQFPACILHWYLLPSMYLTWTATSQDTKICSLPARLSSHLLQQTE